MVWAAVRCRLWATFLSLSFVLFFFFCALNDLNVFISVTKKKKEGKSWSLSLTAQAHRDKDIAEGGDDAAAETHDQSSVRGDHELSCCSQGDASCQRGVLDVHLPGKAAC